MKTLKTLNSQFTKMQLKLRRALQSEKSLNRITQRFGHGGKQGRRTSGGAGGGMDPLTLSIVKVLAAKGNVFGDFSTDTDDGADEEDSSAKLTIMERRLQ
eukprot:6565747-Prorocentrum_lima.AAC.1